MASVVSSFQSSKARTWLNAADGVRARDRCAMIGGYNAGNVVIRDYFQGITASSPKQKPWPFNLIFETPARAPFTDQVAATVATLDTIIAS